MGINRKLRKFIEENTFLQKKADYPFVY